ncbi:MAG: hypothetical protein WC496_00150 [Phycisphaerae bacterium]
MFSPQFYWGFRAATVEDPAIAFGDGGSMGSFVCFKAKSHWDKIQSDVPTSSFTRRSFSEGGLLVSKA